MYDKIIKLPTDINNNAAEIGADWKNKLVKSFKFILKSFREIFSILWDLDAFIITIINPIDWATTVAIPIPDITKAGIGPNPKINNGLNNIIKKIFQVRVHYFKYG